MIRAHLKNIIKDSNKIINVYVPSICGKEKRKAKASKEGILGVEGMNKQIIIDALNRCGAISDEEKKDGRKITKTDMFLCGLSGSCDSSQKRKSLLEYLELPQNLSPNATLDILNTYFSYEEFSEMIIKWQKKETKN
jgi:ribonuclease M5